MLSRWSDHYVEIWSMETRARVTGFTAESGVSCLAAADKQTLVAGEESGRIHFLRLESAE